MVTLPLVMTAFAIGNDRVCHRQQHPRRIPVQRGETPLSVGTSAAVVFCDFACQSLGSIEIFGTLHLCHGVRHIVKYLTCRHQPRGKFVAVAVDDAAHCGDAFPPAVVYARQRLFGYEQEHEQSEPRRHDVLPARAREAEPQPQNRVDGEHARRGRPLREGQQSRCDGSGQNREGEEIQRLKSERRPHPGKRGERKSRGGRNAHRKQHHKKCRQCENEGETLYAHSCRRKGESHDDYAACNKLVRRETRVYSSQKHCITYDLCTKRENGDYHRRQHDGGYAAPENGCADGVRNLARYRRNGGENHVDVFAQTEENEIYGKENKHGHRHVKHRPPRRRKGYDRERVNGRDDEHIAPCVHKPRKQSQRERAAEILHRSEQEH